MLGAQNHEGPLHLHWTRLMLGAQNHEGLHRWNLAVQLRLVACRQSANLVCCLAQLRLVECRQSANFVCCLAHPILVMISMIGVLLPHQPHQLGGSSKAKANCWFLREF
jgi:hypothetical protein